MSGLGLGEAIQGAIQRITGANVAGYSIDSRTLRPGDVFFAIVGENDDGHRHVESALKAGAAAAVVEKGRFPANPKLLEVANTLAALQALAHEVRRNWGGPVIGITGSAGKTTTKEMIAAVLSTKLQVLKNQGNLNNQYGVPLTLLRLRQADQVAVVEMGMNHRGEITALAAIAEPNVAVFTNVGEAHLGNFASVDEIAAAKRELAESMPANGTLILNADDARVIRFGDGFAGRRISYGFSASADVRIDASMPLQFLGRHNRSNAGAAIATGLAMGIERAVAEKALAAIQPGANRGDIIHQAGITFLNDCYNSNPSAAAQMLEVLRNEPGKRHIAVLGEMRELGPASADLHRKIGKQAAAGGIDALFGVQGDAAEMLAGAREGGFRGESKFFASAAECGTGLQNYFKSGDVALWKASRAVKLEVALAAVRAALPAES